MQIKLKTEGNNIISEFFSSKGVKKEPEANTDKKSSSKESGKIQLPVCLKEAPESTEKTEPLSSIEKEEHGSKSTVISEDTNKCQAKRDYEELSVDSKRGTEETDKLYPTPAKKKGSIKNAVDNKQPTLFSYFGKS